MAAKVAVAVPSVSAPVEEPVEPAEDIEPAGNEGPALVESPTNQASGPVSEGAPNAWPDESIEAAMLSDLRGRGEPVVPVAAPPPAEEENDKAKLPALSELVARISPEVRDALDDLFRVKFVAVRRIPAKVLKP